MFDGSDFLQQDVCLTCLVSFPLRRPGWASEHQSAQLPAVLPLSLLAETHPGWSEGAGAAGPPPAGSGRHQGSALHPPDVLQGHLQPPDAGGQRQLLLAVQWVWQWPSGLLRQIPDDHFSLYLLGKDFASSWSEDDWILCLLVQDVRLSVFEGDLARGEAETAKTPRPPANQSPGSRRWRFVLHSNHSYLNLCIKPCKNNQRCFTLKTCLCDVNITNCCIFCVYLSAHETVIWSLCGSGKSLPGGPGTTQQHNDILKMTAEFNPNCWLTFQASLELLFQGRVVPSIFMFLLTGSTDFSFIWNHMPLCVFLFKSWTCFLSGECDGQRGGRLWGQLAPSPWRAAVPGSALRLHGATGLANPQSPKPRLQEEWVSSFSVFLALFLSKVNVWVFKHLMNDRRSQVRFIPIMHSAGVVGRWPRI